MREGVQGEVVIEGRSEVLQHFPRNEMRFFHVPEVDQAVLQGLCTSLSTLSHIWHILFTVQYTYVTRPKLNHDLSRTFHDPLVLKDPFSI